uniref:Deoxygenase n=1 Tax=Leptospira ellisii TaxID=2023197 RepID=A0A2N0B6D6_9LEPT|nr:hypothetical protein CH379_15445 [Leptospira ellisii]
MNSVSKESEFKRDGYFLFRGFFDPGELRTVSAIILRANYVWRKKHDFIGNVNSAYLTGKDFLTGPEDRETMFRFLSSERLVSIARIFLNSNARFLNTQLFFDPEEGTKRPYWHRDVQYLGAEEEEQKNIIRRDGVLHFRIPLREDPGLELIPGSHTRWDTPLEFDTRMERNGRRHSDELPGSIRIPHSPGDLLVFSAHTIHRGVYGSDRSSFDILYTSFPAQKSEIDRMRHFPDSDSIHFERSIFRTT